MDYLVEALEKDLDEKEKIIEGQQIYIEVLEEENEEYRKKIKELEEQLYKAERSKPIWENNR